MAESPETIPIVDISSLYESSPDSAAWTEIATQLDASLHSIGFVYLANTGIPEEVINAAFEASDTFFQLDLKVKNEYSKNFAVETVDDYDSFAGYTPPGAELEGDADYEHKETFDLCGSNRFYPDAVVPTFRQAFDDLESHLQRITELFTRVVATSLGVKDPNIFLDAIRHLREPGFTSCFRALYYPPINDDALTCHQNPTRCAAHTDYGFITLLVMDKDAVGLEVKSGDKWIPANPIPGAVLLNVAYLLELWSDGRYPASLHRVCLPQLADHKFTSRKTMAYFVNAEEDVEVRALNTKFNGGNPQRTEIWNAHQYIKERSRIAYSSILNSNISK